MRDCRTVHDNIFVDSAMNAITLADHDLPLMQAFVYNNTIYATDGGIVFGSAAPQGDAVFGNLVFAANPIGGTITDERDNLVAAVAEAPQHVTAPSLTLGEMDFYPLVGPRQGSALDMSKAASDVDHDVDFNGTPKAGFTFCGAYAGEGQNPGWQLTDDIKHGGGMGVGGGAATSGAGGGAPSSGPGAGTNGPDEGDDGCGCRVAGDHITRRGGPLWFLAVALPWLRRRRHR